MAKDGQGPAALGALGLIVALAGFEILQTHEVEKRLVVQGQQIRALGEAVERLSGPGGMQRGAASSFDSPRAEEYPPPPHMLHPELPNFLKPHSKRWPLPNQALDGTLIRGFPNGDPKGFNPIIEISEDVEILGAYAGASLAGRDPWVNPNDWNGDLATRVEITDDSKEFTIYLKKGVKWHVPIVDLDDPKHRWMKGDHFVTADDVVFTLDLIMNPQVSNGFLKNYYKELESYRAVDDGTVVIRWKKKEYLNLEVTLSTLPVPKFLYGADEDGTPFPKETLGLRVNQHWYNNKGFIGAGPYRMSSYQTGTRMVFDRNEDYAGDKPPIKQVQFLIYTDPQQTLLKLKAHEIQIGSLTPGQYREEIQPYEHGTPAPKDSPFFDGRIIHDFVPRFAYYFIGWNEDRPFFADKRVRKAMTLALNRDQLVESVFAGLGKVISSPYPPDSPANDPGTQPLPFNLEQAKALLAEAGWTDTDGDGLVDAKLRPSDTKRSPFEFSLLIYGSSKEFTALANIYKEDLLKIGVKVNIDSAEWSLMQKRMAEKNFDAYTGGVGMVWEQDLYQTWHSSQADIAGGTNHVGFRNKAADVIIEKLRVTFDQDERVALLREFHRLIAEEQPYTFIISPKTTTCHWSDVKDVVFPKISPAIYTLPWSVARAAN